MINRNYIIIYDFETSSINPYKTQPIQLAAIVIDPRSLEFIPNSEFNSLIQPIWEREKQLELELDDIEQKALDVNGKTIEELKTAPLLKTVWENFTKYCKNYNISGKKWDAPILSGYNIIGFDNIILKRIARQYGPWDSEREHCTLFHPVHDLDVMKIVFPWFESNYELNSLSMDSLRDYFGMSKENAHDALQDVKDTGNILIRFLKLHRNIAKNVSWKTKAG